MITINDKKSVKVRQDSLALSALSEAVRPADSTAYTALDVFADANNKVWVFPALARTLGGGGYIVKAEIYSSLKTDVDQYRLHLYTDQPAALIADNSPYLLLYADARKRVGTINFGATTTEDSTNSTMASALLVPGAGNLPLIFNCAPGFRDLYGVVEVVLGHTPASQDKLTIRLTSDPF